jgi:acyl CoA:acetate/3-ketoacid CoA transferase
MGTLTTKGLEETVGDGRLHLHQDGKIKKFVEKLDQVSFSGPFALEKGQTILYVTERAVFELTEDGVALVELAPGVELEKDVLDKMAFRPIVSPDLKPMDPKLFRAERMGLSTRTWEAGA